MEKNGAIMLGVTPSLIDDVSGRKEAAVLPAEDPPVTLRICEKVAALTRDGRSTTRDSIIVAALEDLEFQDPLSRLTTGRAQSEA